MTYLQAVEENCGVFGIGTVVPAARARCLDSDDVFEDVVTVGIAEVHRHAFAEALSEEPPVETAEHLVCGVVDFRSGICG